MSRRIRAARPGTAQVATCDEHLPIAMVAVTAPPNGDTHLLVQHLPAGDRACAYDYLSEPNHDAQWLLTPQAVIA